MNLDQLVDLPEMYRLLEAGYLREQSHNEFPNLRVIGYTEKVQFENYWTPVTSALRGVIYDADDLEVLARPFAKFFNYGDDTNTGQLDPDAPVKVYDKMDGSLGIGYIRPDGRFAIATRGSFHSDQADWANSYLHDRRSGDFLYVETGYTPLYEIIYPENRIVVDYEGMEELTFLGAVDMETGEYMTPYPGRGAVESFDFHTLREAIESPPRSGREGFVIWFDNFTPVKFKYEEYKALHRIVSNLTYKEVWRQMRDGTFETYVLDLPDEFHVWAITVAADIQDQADEILAQVYLDFRENMHHLAESRKNFAIAVKDLHTKSYLFTLADGRDIMPAIWEAIEPVGKESDVSERS